MDNLLVEEKSMLTMEDVETAISQFRIQLDTFNGRLSQAGFGSKIYQTKETIASKGRFIAGAKEDVVIMDGQNPTWRLWAGASNPASAPFRVDKDGNMVATSITLTGYVQTGGAAADINANATTISGGKITTNSITANKISVSNLSSISADIGTITAGTINGITITGGTVQTASSGLRVVMNGSTGRLEFKSGSTSYASMYPYAGGSNIGVQLETLSGSSGGQVILNEGTSFNYAALLFAGNGIIVDYSNSVVESDYTFRPSSSASYDLGGSSSKWRNMYLNSVGQVSSGGSAGTPFPSGWSVSNIATGRYEVTHNFGTTSYSVVATVNSSIAKIWCIESKGSNSFIVRIANTSFSLENNAFEFVVIRN